LILMLSSIEGEGQSSKHGIWCGLILIIILTCLSSSYNLLENLGALSEEREKHFIYNFNTKDTITSVEKYSPELKCTLCTFKSNDTFLGINSSVGIDHQTRQLAQVYKQKISEKSLQERDGRSERKISSVGDVRKQKVFLPHSQGIGVNSVSVHIIMDGLAKSELLEHTYNMNDADAVWVVDLVGFNCMEKLLPLVVRTLEKRARSSDPKSLQHWRVILLDYFDHGYARWKGCTLKLSAMLGKENVFYATRYQMKDRRIVHEQGEDENVPFHDLGHHISFIKPGEKIFSKGVVVRQLRYCIRTDQVEYLQRILQNDKNIQGRGEMDPVTLPRSFDVAHFWEVGSDIIHGNHRDEISKTLLQLSRTTNVTAFAGLKGHRGPTGRQHAQGAYLEALLDYKIVVVCQRDKWEGHWRLMEALLGGGMVMTDPMHPLPYLFEDGKSVIVYKSIAELKEKILYFLGHEDERLEIARRGHEIAMNHHRSWHIMERIVLGNWSDIYI